MDDEHEDEPVPRFERGGSEGDGHSEVVVGRSCLLTGAGNDNQGKQFTSAMTPALVVFGICAVLAMALLILSKARCDAGRPGLGRLVIRDFRDAFLLSQRVRTPRNSDPAASLR